MRKALKRLKGYTGRVMRDLRRHLDDIVEGGLRDRIIAALNEIAIGQPGVTVEPRPLVGNAQAEDTQQTRRGRS